jgi:hypothetical protein
MKSVPVLAISFVMTSTLFASSDAILIKDAPACKRAGSFSEIAAPYVAAQTKLNADREKAEKERQKQAAQTSVMPGQAPGVPNGLPPGVPTPPPGQTGFVPQWKPGQTWTPGQTAFKPPTPSTTSVPTPNQPAMPGQPVQSRGFPRPVGCGRH